jgi:hypothetical protein
LPVEELEAEVFSVLDEHHGRDVVDDGVEKGGELAGLVVIRAAGDGGGKELAHALAQRAREVDLRDARRRWIG